MPELDPWYRVAVPRKEVREGRSFNPDEFAIHLEQVVSRRGAEDYREPDKFFSRNVFTRALKDHAGMVLRRLAGKTENTAPVLTLVTQFGGGKTHTLTTLFHLATSGKGAAQFSGVVDLLTAAGLSECPGAKVAAFVGNAWDPQVGRETPWLDIAFQLAGAEGVQALGVSAQKTAPGTDALAKLFEAAGDSVLILCDEVLNFCNRHRELTDGFYAFIQNLTVAMTATTHGAAVISLPRSQVEMTDWDLQWQERITKVVRRVAKDLIANDEAEISEVVRRRLFEELGPEKTRRTVAKVYADYCFERRAQLPSEWTAVDSASTEVKAREFLRNRFEACYPFHPATLSVFQRKWQALPQFQQTRGTLAMFAQWISWAFDTHHREQVPEPLLTLGSAPLHVPAFRSAVLGQLGEPRLAAAIDADIAGAFSHSRALDADTKGPLKDIHRRVATTILFESSGGQSNKIAHLPDLRFALCNPPVDTTSVDNAALALEARAFFIRKLSSDGFQIQHQPTLKKVVNDRRASLDLDKDVRPRMRKAVMEEFDRGATVRVERMPKDSTDIDNLPRLRIVPIDPATEWSGNGPTRELVRLWTYKRGEADRDYPAAIVWCLKKPGRELQEKVELLLAWQQVEKDIRAGVLGTELPPGEVQSVAVQIKDKQDDLQDEVAASYRFAVLADGQDPSGLRVIDLGSGHSSGGETTMCGRIIAAMMGSGLLNESVGAGYLERWWPVALKQVGAWPLAGLRKCFLDGSLPRLLDPDTVLRNKIQEFISKGEFGLASGAKPDGTYERIWFGTPVPQEEITFESGVFLLRKERAKALQQAPGESVATPAPPTLFPVEPDRNDTDGEGTQPSPEPAPASKSLVFKISGSVPAESWNRFGSKLLPKLRTGDHVQARVELSCRIDSSGATNLETDVRQLLDDLGLSGQFSIEKTSD
jgi:hypothetical protein